MSQGYGSLRAFTTVYGFLRSLRQLAKKEQSVFGFYGRIRQYGHPAPSGRNITEIETGMGCQGGRIRQSANCDKMALGANGNRTTEKLTQLVLCDRS